MSDRQSVTVIRHSQATPVVEGSDDSIRTLNNAGIQLALRRKESFGKKPFHFGIVSDRIRALQTLQIVGGFGESKPNYVRYPELFNAHTEEDNALINEMYKRIGSNPLETFLAHGTRKEIIALTGLARRGWQMIQNAVVSAHAENTLVVNHEVFAPAILWTGCQMDMRFYDTLLGRKWEMCDGVDVTLENGKIVDIVGLPKLDA